MTEPFGNGLFFYLISISTCVVHYFMCVGHWLLNGYPIIETDSWVYLEEEVFSVREHFVLNLQICSYDWVSIKIQLQTDLWFLIQFLLQPFNVYFVLLVEGQVIVLIGILKLSVKRKNSMNLFKSQIHQEFSHLFLDLS